MVAYSDAASAALMERLKRCNILVVGGSGDSVATGAAILRLMAPETQVHVVTPNPNMVRDLEPEKWPSNARVVIAGVAVAKPIGKKETERFVQRVHAAGHQIEAIVDEHSQAEWGRVANSTGFSLEDLAIQPQSQQNGKFRSAGAVLRHALSQVSDFEDDHIAKLLHVAELCDNRDFDDDKVAQMLNAALKAKTGCPLVRTHLVVKLSQSLRLTRKMERLVREYVWILRRHRRILASAVELGDGLLRLKKDGAVDMTRLTRDALLRVGTRVLMIEGLFREAGNENPVRKIALGTEERLPLLTVLRRGFPADGEGDELSGVRATGYEKRPMVKPEDEEQAVRIVRRLLRETAVESTTAHPA